MRNRFSKQYILFASQSFPKLGLAVTQEHKTASEAAADTSCFGFKDDDSGFFSHRGVQSDYTPLELNTLLD